jgi:hypothetical protein
MNVLEAVAGKMRLGWDSPVSEVVNPAFIELNGRGGLGWLKGFNELVTRCGYEWVGHPGMDQGVLLPLHGLAANIPASKVVLSIEEKPPYTIRFKGDLKEQVFKKVNFLVETELSTEAGAEFFTLHDTPTLVRRYWTRAPASARPDSRSHPSMTRQWQTQRRGG